MSTAFISVRYCEESADRAKQKVRGSQEASIREGGEKLDIVHVMSGGCAQNTRGLQTAHVTEGPTRQNREPEEPFRKEHKLVGQDKKPCALYRSWFVC